MFRFVGHLRELNPSMILELLDLVTVVDNLSLQTEIFFVRILYKNLQTL